MKKENQQQRKLYVYQGMVMHFNLIAARFWEARTYAVSEKQARNNLAFQYKRKNGFTANYNVVLPGELKEVELPA